MTVDPHVRAFLQLITVTPDPEALSPEDLRAEYSALGYDLDADLASLRALLDRAVAPGGKVLIFVGEHAQDLVEAALFGLDDMQVLCAADEAALVETLSLHARSDVVIVAMDSGGSQGSERLLLRAAALRPQALRLRIRVAASYRRGAPLTVTPSGAPRLSRPVLVAGPLPANFEQLCATALGPGVTVHALRPSGTLPPDPNIYGLIVLWSCHSDLERRLGQLAPDAVMVSICDPARLARAAWCIGPLNRAVMQLAM